MQYVETTTKIWLTMKSGLYQFPMNPEKLEFPRTAPQDKFEIIGLGQITNPKSPNLRVIKWNSYFPREMTAYTGAAQTPQDFVDALNAAMESKEVCVLTVRRKTGGDSVLNVVISAFNPADVGGTPNDVDYSIEFTEWRDSSPITLDVTTDEAKPKAKKKKQRKQEPVLTVGAKVLANGKYFYDSYGSEPHGTANNKLTYVKRIVEGRAYPVLIGDKSPLGWIKQSDIQIKG